MKGKLLTFHLLIFSDSPAQVKFLFTMGRRILNIRTLNSYRLLFGSICSFLCTEEWFIKTQVPYFWQLLLTHCFPDLGLLDRYFKMNITQVCIGEIGDWASINFWHTYILFKELAWSWMSHLIGCLPPLVWFAMVVIPEGVVVQLGIFV